MEAKIKVSAHVLAFNEERIIPFVVRHYLTYCHRVTVHDLGSKDRTRKNAAYAGANIRQWDCKGMVDDILNMRIKNTCWPDSDSDWIVCADADEFIYFPSGAEDSLTAYEKQELAIVKPIGFEMLSDTFPDTKGQIYEQVKYGARDDHWYAKPILFSQRRVAKTEIGMGAHEVGAILKNGSEIHVGQGAPPSDPLCYMLHFHHVRPIKEIGEDYEAHIHRQCEMNKKMGWGIQHDGHSHARDKRKYIMDRLERVIP